MEIAESVREGEKEAARYIEIEEDRGRERGRDFQLKRQKARE